MKSHDPVLCKYEIKICVGPEIFTITSNNKVFIISNNLVRKNTWVCRDNLRFGSELRHIFVFEESKSTRYFEVAKAVISYVTSSTNNPSIFIF